MHSDESWLSGLTRAMMHDGLNSTEYFFDLIPRYPHAIKIIFHILQMPFIMLFGYSLFSVRLMSLIFGIIALILFFKTIHQITDSFGIAFLGMVVLSLDIQFIYASHFARQEIIITAFILAAIYYILSKIKNWKIKNDVIAGCLIGFSIGIHPNSFLAALIIGAIYLYYIIFEKKIKLKNLIFLIFTVSIFAGLFILISFSFNSNFINDYLKYGDELGATASGIFKLFSFPNYYKKLYVPFSVTYYTPSIKVEFILFALGFIAALISLFFGKNKKNALLFVLPIFALNIGYLIIGRYSQPGIVLLFPLCYLLIFLLINKINTNKIVPVIVLCIIVAINTFSQITVKINNDYSNYIYEVQSVIPRDSKVLANLNTEYAFDYNKLLDYRNLSQLNDRTFEEYIRDNQIEYIIYPEEMDFIYNNRPVWNVLYGNVFPYYEDMNFFLTENCILVYSFDSSYAMRILMFSEEKEWNVKIYKVKENNQIE